MLSVTAFLLLLVSAVAGGSTEVVVTPPHQQIETPGTATVTCEFPARPLVGCRILVSDHGGGRFFDSLLDFGPGAKFSQVELRDENDGELLGNASYHGLGLREGQCGLQLELAKRDWLLYLMVECLGQTEDGGWDRGLGLVTASDRPVLPVIRATPLMMVVAPHSSVAVAFKALDGEALDGCTIGTPKAGWVYVTPSLSFPAGNWYRHDNASFARGACGCSLVNFTQDNSGVWWWWADKGLTLAMQATVVLVKEAPVGWPQLTVADASTLRVGGRLQATCRAPPGVPPAELSWWLGGRQLRVRVSPNMTRPEDLQSAFPWQPKPVVQTLNLTLAETDVGQLLECRMAHVAMPRTRSDWHDLAVEVGDACGRRSRRRLAGSTALSAGGRAARKAEFPWHVGVYRLFTDKGVVVSYQQQCGGTLVSRHFFISAAHCFWDASNKQHKNATSYRATLGKHTLAWETEDARVQRREIAAIHLPPNFGTSRNFEADIALVRLSAPAVLSEDVDVVCVDWGHRFVFEQSPLAANRVGTVPGWGLTENKERTKILRFVDLPYVPFEECKASVPEDFKRYLLIDKICGGFVNRSTGVCIGDSGGGYVFPEGRKEAKRYFLRAVVSNGPGDRGSTTKPCRPEHVSVFTLVSMYSAWMHGIMLTAEGRPGSTTTNAALEPTLSED